jgi:hypothetical protein
MRTFRSQADDNVSEIVRDALAQVSETEAAQGSDIHHEQLAAHAAHREALLLRSVSWLAASTAL